MTVHHLKPVRTSDASFSQLLHADGSIFTDEDKQERCNELLKIYEDISPDILMTEAFPFGRRQMRFELLPLLEKAKQSDEPPMIIASIRDIMQEDRKEKRVQESNELVAKCFDRVFVHGDENLIRIEETLQGAKSFSDKIRYTGLVSPEISATENSSNLHCEVLVTVGGGAFGQKLTRTALTAMQHSKEFPSNWIVSAGTEVSNSDYNLLKEQCPPGMKIVRYIPDLANAMRNIRVSVSHAGYNTVGDILRSGCAAVLYPYTGGRETEQLRRAEIMDRRNVAVMLDPDLLSPLSLATAIDKAANLSKSNVNLELDGANKTASLIKEEFSNFRCASC
jgi:predicted glycosyltransferase